MIVRGAKVGYRYLDQEWGPRFWQLGLIGLSTTGSVALIEGRQRDAEDAAINVTFDGQIRNSATQPELVAAALRAGVFMDENCRDIRLEVTNTIRQHGFMFCMSSRPDNPAFRGKGWVFEIFDIRAFALEVTKAAGGAIPDHGFSGPVRYEPRAFDAAEAEGIGPDPFVKASGQGYEEEEEIRIFWRTEREPKRLSVLTLLALKYVRLVRRP